MRIRAKIVNRGWVGMGWWVSLLLGAYNTTPQLFISKPCAPAQTLHYSGWVYAVGGGMYQINGRFLHVRFFCSSARGSFLLLSVAGYAGGPCEHWVHVWALAEVRGTCSGGSKSRKLVNNHGVAFRLARAN